MILRFLFYAFLFYLAYRLLFDLVLPIYRTTRQVRRGFREMQDRMNQHAQPFRPETGPAPQQKVQSDKAGDYIEFEEIK